MRTCLSCRARRREFRAAPERVAALVPPAALVATDGGGPVRNLIESVAGLGDRLHAAAELATGQKIAAVAASAAALAGGGSAIDEFANHQGPPLPEPVEQVEARPVEEAAPVESPPPAAESAPPDAAPTPSPAPAPEQAPPPPPPPNPANEFEPAATPAAAAPAPAPAPAPATAPAQPTAGGSVGSGEFAP
jgi:outer membrane biosynthesis protein TonB